MTATNSGGETSAQVSIAVNDVPPSALTFDPPEAVLTPDLFVGTAGIVHFLLRLTAGPEQLGFPLLLPARYRAVAP